MWLLLLVICTSTVGGVPVHPTQVASSHAADNVTVTTMHEVPKSAATEASKVDALNGTQNVTSPATGAVASVLEPQRESAETLEELKEEMAVQEGDILIQEDRNAVQSVWADATVPYIISPGLAGQEFNILTAFRMISDFTCLRFVPHNGQMNYLEFKDGKGCASYVGCQGGAQPVYYARSCSVGNLCHEIVHALGLHHEHTRSDRDQYIDVQWQNIMPRRKSNFKVQRGDTMNLPYDLNSIMHYGQYFFSVDGSPTVLSRQRGVHIGQRMRLSQLDIQRVNRLYHCEERRRNMGR